MAGAQAFLQPDILHPGSVAFMNAAQTLAQSPLFYIRRNVRWLSIKS